MTVENDPLLAAQLRAEQARAKLGLTVKEIGSRMAPITLAGNAMSRVRAANVDWLNMAWRIYRYRGTAMTILGALAAFKARTRRKRKARVPDDEGVNTVPDANIDDTERPSRRKIRNAAGSAARKAAEARAAASEKASAAYAYSRNTGTRITQRVAAGVQEHPLSVVLGTMALGVLAAVVLPRVKSAATKASDSLPMDELRDKAAQTARETFHAISDRLDELGINRESAREVVAKVRDVAIDAASQAATAAQEALDRTRRHH
mgnify:FL=1